MSKRRHAAAVLRFPGAPPKRPADECRGCGEKQPEPLAVDWPWCLTCTLRWRIEHGGERGMVAPPRSLRR